MFDSYFFDSIFVWGLRPLFPGDGFGVDRTGPAYFCLFIIECILQVKWLQNNFI